MTRFRASGGVHATFEIVKGAVWTVSLCKLTERVIHALFPKRHSVSDTTLRALVDNNLSVVREHHCWGFWLKLSRTFWSCEPTATAKKRSKCSVLDCVWNADDMFYPTVTNAMILKKLQVEPLKTGKRNDTEPDLLCHIRWIQKTKQNQAILKREQNSIASFSPTKP